ncbi:hypothetical protein Tco_0114001 [Tanacetum coccineum]
MTSGQDTIWVIVDRLTKSVHFLPIKETVSTENFTPTTVITLVSRLHRLKLSMAENVDRLFVGLRLGTLSSLKSYANMRRKPLEFEVGDKVMLKVSSWKGVIRFGKRGKLNPRYIGPFRIIAKIDDKLNFIEEPVEIMDREVKRLKQKSEPHSNRKSLLEFEMRARVYLGARRPNEEKVLSSFR